MKVFDNINNLNDEVLQKELTRIIKETVPLRKNKNATIEYCDNFLFADKRKKEYCDFSSDEEILWLKEHPFILNDGEIPVNHAARLRHELLQVIENDKYSFGYLYYRLIQDENQNRLREGINTFLTFEISNEDNILYTIDFDIDDLNKSITELDSIERIKYLQNRLHKSEACGYESQFKDAFEEHCKTLIDEAKEMLTFERNLNTPVRKQYEFKLTKEQERSLQIAVDNGYIEKTETGYRKKCSKAMLGYLIERVFAPENKEHLPYKALEELFNEKRLDRTINANHDVNNPQKWRYLIDNMFGN